MSFGREFEQSPMDSFLFKKGNQSNFATPIKSHGATTLSVDVPDSPMNTDENHDAANNDDTKKATKYDYLDYGNYINRVLASQSLMDSGSSAINWNMPRTADKVHIVNAMLSIIENRKLYESLLQQSRDTIESLKVELHRNENKNKSLHQQNKQMDQKMSALFQSHKVLESQIKSQAASLKEKIKALTKQNENLKYRDKTYQNQLRKKEKTHKAQQEKIKRLLDDRDKKSMKCLGMKLLNQKVSTSILNHPNSLKTKKGGAAAKGLQQKQYEKSVEEQQRVMAENNLLQSQVAHIQNQLQSVLNENNLLRESLLKLEVNCKESLLKINDLFANSSNKIQRVNTHKYSMPFDRDTQSLVTNDIAGSVHHLGAVLDDLKVNLDRNDNKESVERMRREIVHLKSTVQELEETNKEYESLIRTYVNNE